VLDFLVAPAVEDGPRNDPPVAPSVGESHIVGASPTGEWAGKPNFLAGYTTGGWRLLSPTIGATVYVKATESWAIYRSGAWEIGTLRGARLDIGGQQVVGARLPGIASPSGGVTVDDAARTAIQGILQALRAHGLIET
jgi:hypothetical protein